LASQVAAATNTSPRTPGTVILSITTLLGVVAALPQT
jgi:hypothetical protein